MKLVRFGPRGHEHPGIIDSDGQVRDLSDNVADIGADTLAPNALRKLATLDLSTLKCAPSGSRLGVPVSNVGKFIAIGLNYVDHAKESNLPIPTEPVIFTKAVSCLCGPNDDLKLPPGSTMTDWEVELGVVIGSTARHVSESDAQDCIAGYTVVNDVTERSYQMERGGTWDKGKGYDNFGPVGPWLVTADEVGDAQSLDLYLNVNDQRMQTGNTRTMIFDVPQLIAYVSRFITLYPGDILTTGTPPGVGMGKKPQPVFLRSGDTLRLGIEKLGAQCQRVI